MAGSDQFQGHRKFMEVAWPLFALPYLVAKYLNMALFGWWLDRWMQARENKSLSREIADTMPFLSSEGHVVKRRLRVQPFDYASVYIDKDGVRVCVTRGRGELNLSLAPSAFPGDEKRLGVIL
jgi:hypothetical protein